jgi:hypothetical protein
MPKKHRRKNKSKNEQKLHETYINAQYEYFKHIEPLRLSEINEKLRGKVLKPSVERENEYYKSLGIGIKKEDCKMLDYKELLLCFHPDKNSNRIDEATEHFKYLNKIIDENKTDILNDLLEADDKWTRMNEIRCKNSIYDKEKYCKNVLMSNWYNWSEYDYSKYVTEEEYRKLMIEDCERLKKENEKLREEIKLRNIEKSELCQKINNESK